MFRPRRGQGTARPPGGCSRHEPAHASAAAGVLTAPDRYYLAWMQYQDEQGNEPSDEELSAYCAE
ncbi:hypothetical protein ACFU96_43950 [Streptomyces sp. NPDC057620]|uniref:hypothetical protein n=1 Tax=Streptomyces sp. NPDC057620 TaxID=3346185 RepID=UPI003699F6F5